MSEQGIHQFLKDVKDAGMISQLSEQYSIESYSKKQTLYQEGKRPRFLYYLVKGKVKGFRTHEDGKDYITDIFSDGDFMGYPALIEDKNYDDSAVVLEESEIMQIPKDEFLQMIYGDMNVAAKFIRIITQNVKEKEERLLNLAYSSLRKRVAKALVDLNGKYNDLGGNKPIEISREDIAHYVGTATESLIRTLSDFKSEKLIEIKEGKIRISDIEKLNNLLY
jgi:CRP-like cAMP-binding protein